MTPACSNCARITARARHTAAYGAQRYGENVGGVLIRDLVDGDQSEDLTHFRRKIAERALCHDQQFLLDQAVAGIEFARGHADQAFVRFKSVYTVRRAAEIIPNHVHGDAKEPGGKFGIAAESRDGARRFRECLLGNICGVIRMIDVLDDEAVQTTLVLGNQLPEQLLLIEFCRRRAGIDDHGGLHRISGGVR